MPAGDTEMSSEIGHADPSRLDNLAFEPVSASLCQDYRRRTGFIFVSYSHCNGPNTLTY
ncbi:hypothetical protein [Erythrobacter longus]|uniref:hypothetical protein n=1 Tax=Erythrobacter longus TaxID=1044 RepID=UPI001F51FD65|nr:hypothetical protein [Erythrobacter longus]